MMRTAIWMVILVVGATSWSRAAETTLTIHPDLRHQTILGWSCNPFYLEGAKEQREQVIDEAGNNNAFRPQVVIEMTRVLGDRMAKLGLPTRGQFSDGVNANATWNYIQAAKDDPELWKYVGVLSYHWYGGNNQEAMARIRQFAEAQGLKTAQTEYMGLTMNHLYDDLTIGGVSYWCIYGLGGPGPGGANFTFHLNNTSFSRGGQFWNFRQVMHYVRPGAVRIEASSDTPALRSLAFVRDGRTTMALINNTPPRQARAVTVQKLPPGDYPLYDLRGRGAVLLGAVGALGVARRHLPVRRQAGG